MTELDRGRMLADVLDHVPMGIAVMDGRGAAIYANQYASMVLGPTADGAPAGHSVSERYHAYRVGTDQPYPEADGVLVRALRGESATVDDVEIRRPDGFTIPLEVTGYPIRDASGAITHAMLAFRDVSERRRAREETEKLETQLRVSQKLDALGRLAAGIAHDFNNLLTVINGSSELLLAQSGIPDPSRKLVRAVHEAGERAADLTARLMQFGRGSRAAAVPLDVDEIIADMGQLLRRVIGDQVTMAVRPAAAGARILVERAQLEQVVMNLMINGRDAMPRGGALTLETASVELDDAYAATHFNVLPGSYVMVAVSDTGAGMDATTREQIFEPFFSTKPGSRGTGLGLATVYTIMKQTGGSIWLYSEVGKGTTFKMYFPRQTGAAPVSAPFAAKPAGGRERVVVLEDDVEVRGLIIAALERYGYVLREAADIEEALARCAEGADLLVTDVILTGESGREAAERARAAHPGLKVLFMSGYTDEAIAKHGVLEDGVAFIQKPFALPALAAKVREVLDRRG